jgi:hypothetical protein
MIARIWRGVVRLDDADEYTDYIRDTGFTEYAETSGNRGAWMLRRDQGDRTDFLTLSLWENVDGIPCNPDLQMVRRMACRGPDHPADRTRFRQIRPAKSAPHCLLRLKTSATPTYWSVNGSPGRGRRPVHRAGWP